MTVLVLDPFAGVAGDMLLGLLLDLGYPLEELRAALDRSGLTGFRLAASETRRQGLRGLQLQVEVTAPQHHRTWQDIDRWLETAELPATPRDRSRAVFRRLAVAEGRVHGIAPEDVHFHEVGAVDALVDILGTCLGLAALGVDRVVCGPLPLCRGFIDSAHGRLPLPAPAVLELCRELPHQWQPGEGELVTPTGAALVGEMAEFSPYPAGRILRTGSSAGGRDLADRPNLLRGWLLAPAETATGDQVELLECHLDDCTPQVLGALLEDLLAAGALDVGFSPLQMKKNRPGQRLTVVAPLDHADALSAWILRHSTSAGVRRSLCRRDRLAARLETVATALGPVRVKIFTDAAGPVRLAPEYDDCRQLAQQCGRPLADILREVTTAAYTTLLPGNHR